jgi:hypothetical protein
MTEYELIIDIVFQILVKVRPHDVQVSIDYWIKWKPKA